MAGELEQLKELLPADLEQYKDDDIRLQFALDVAVSKVNERRGYRGEGYEERFRTNVLQGAIWWLGKQGAEGYSSTSENGISVNWQEVPDWLQSVVPRLGVLK